MTYEIRKSCGKYLLLCFGPYGLDRIEMCSSLEEAKLWKLFHEEDDSKAEREVS